MSTMRVVAFALAVSIGGGPGLVPVVEAQETPGSKSVAPAAGVDGEVVLLAEVEQALSAELAKLEQQRFDLLEQKIEQLIGARLLAQEAKKRGTTLEQLLKAEVYARAPEVTDDEVTTFMTQNRARLPQADEAELRLKVWDYLRSQKLNQQRQTYVQTLRARAKVAIHLQEPSGARVQISPDKGFARGPKEAPVAIVEFSDFQCPFCKTVLPIVAQVMDRYPGKIKWVFRDFPIVSIHPAAPKAHEAARCAGSRGSSGSTTTCSSTAPRGTPLKSSGNTRRRSGSTARRSPSAWAAASIRRRSPGTPRRERASA